jgi:hypothetical protein
MQREEKWSGLGGKRGGRRRGAKDKPIHAFRFFSTVTYKYPKILQSGKYCRYLQFNTP